MIPGKSKSSLEFFTKFWPCFSALKTDPIGILIFFEKSLKELKVMKLL